MGTSARGATAAGFATFGGCPCRAAGLDAEAGAESQPVSASEWPREVRGRFAFAYSFLPQEKDPTFTHSVLGCRARHSHWS